MFTSWLKRALPLLLALLLAIAALPGSTAQAQEGSPVSGDGVVPILVDGNPSCTSLKYGYGFKIEGNYNQTVKMDGSASGTSLVGGAPPDPVNTITVSSADNIYFNWLSTLGIDAVIVKGGDEANAYVYLTEDKSDTGLASPVNASGKPAAISHIEFCYDYELLASKTAQATWYKNIDWSITKDYDKSYTGFAGDVFPHAYLVKATKVETVGPYIVSGVITINNPTPFPVPFTVSDVAGGKSADTLTCGVNTLPPGGSTTCNYSVDLGAKTDGENVATVTSGVPFVKGAVATATYAFGAATLKEGSEPDAITVNDTNGQSWTTNVTKSWEYNKNFPCPTDPAKYTDGVYTADPFVNTATIQETGEKDTATVNLTCYAPVVTKDATASYDETHTWTLKKSVAPTAQSGYPGDTLKWEWKVEVSEKAEISKIAVTGKIYVKNPSPDKEMLVSVADALDDGTTASVDCGGGSTSLTIAAGKTGECSYSAAPTGITAKLNTATVKFNELTFTGSKAFTYTKNVIGGEGTLTDLQINLNEKLAAGAGPWTFKGPESHTCSSSASAYGPDGTYTGKEDNTAKLLVGSDELTATASTTYTCQASFMDLKKLTNGAVDPSTNWEFKLYYGPDGFGTSVLASASTSGDADGLLDFGAPALNPTKTYTVCELNIPAGYSSRWEWLANGAAVVPYNPNANDNPPADIGNRCVDFGKDTLLPLTVGQTLHFQVDNRSPGGAPRTPGYWKNWNGCTGGGQAANAARNGGYEKGFWLIEDVLNPAIGGGIVWDDILVDNKLVSIKTCEQAVEILDQRVVTINGTVGDGKKLASDAARTLAMHLLAAQLNAGAGACAAPQADQAVLAGEALLDKLNFDGLKTGAYLTTKSSDYAEALRLAKILDEYNNGMYCGDGHP